MSRLTIALASGLHLGTSLSADDANSLVQMPIAAHDQQADDCAEMLPDSFVDWKLCGADWLNTMEEPPFGPEARKHRPRDEAYKMTQGNITYYQVVTDGDDTLDLVVTVAPTSNYSCYAPKNNGKAVGGKDSCFGQLNLMTGTSSAFDFSFYKADGRPHTLKNFMFTVYDVDQETNSDHEYIEFVDTPAKYWTSNDTDGPDDPTAPRTNPTSIARIEDTWRFESRKKGGTSDNPSTFDQVERSRNKRSKIITAQYLNLASFRVRFGHTSAQKQGREFLFSGRVPSFGCPDTPTTTPAPICPDFPTATMNWKTCDESGGARLPKHNNLAGLGPEFSHPQELRFENVANYKGDELDLVVVNSTAYTPFRTDRNSKLTDENDAGVSGCFGVINLQHDTTVTLDFKFYKHGSSDDAPTFDDSDKFVFSLWDIDHSNSTGTFERVKLDTTNIDGDLHIGSNVDVSRTAGEVVLTSKEFGNGTDNPQDDLVAGTASANKRVGMLLKGTNTWRVTFEAVAGKGGRNFMFYGCRTAMPTHP